MMREALKKRLEAMGGFFKKSALTIDEEKFLLKRDYSDKIIHALDAYLKAKHAENSTEALVSDAKEELDGIIAEYESENADNGYELSTIQVFRPIDYHYMYTLGDVLKNEYYYYQLVEEYQKCIERLNKHIAESRKKIEKYKNDPAKKDSVKFLRGSIKSTKKVLKCFKGMLLRQLEDDKKNDNQYLNDYEFN